MFDTQSTTDNEMQYPSINLYFHLMVQQKPQKQTKNGVQCLITDHFVREITGLACEASG